MWNSRFLVRCGAVVGLALTLPTRGAPKSAGDPLRGEKIFLLCRACHEVGPNARNGTGPNLNGLFGRKAGSVEDFFYTEANRASGIVWTQQQFRDYIKDPKRKIPGTAMVFSGLKDDQLIDDLIAFLARYSNDRGSATFHPSNIYRTIVTDRLTITFRTSPTRVIRGSFFQVLFSVGAHGGDSVHSVLVDAVMPEHGHGMNTRVQIDRLREGYRAQGLLLHMSGRWELRFIADLGSGRREIASAELLID